MPFLNRLIQGLLLFEIVVTPGYGQPLEEYNTEIYSGSSGEAVNAGTSSTPSAAPSAIDWTKPRQILDIQNFMNVCNNLIQNGNAMVGHRS